MIADKLIAHRGWQQRFPENTLLAVQQAIDIGARHIEIDIQLSADLQPWLCHDYNLQRFASVDKLISQCDSKTINQFSAYEPERLGEQFIGTPFCPLSVCIETIKKHPQVTLYVEIKQESISEFGQQILIDQVLPILQCIEQQCFIISFNTDILAAVAALGWKNYAPVLHNWEQALADPMQKLAPPLLFSNINHIAYPGALAELPIASAIYEVDNYQLACQLLAQGAALVETFAIGELITEDKV